MSAWSFSFTTEYHPYHGRQEALLAGCKAGLPVAYCLGAVAVDVSAAARGGPCFVFTELFEYSPKIGARAFDAIWQIQESEGGVVIVSEDTLEKVMKQRFEQEAKELGLV
jgi:hypothetical protein